MPEEIEQTEETIARVETPENAKPTINTIARTVAFAVLWLNQLFAFVGAPILDIDQDTIYTVVATILTFGVSIWAWWKNNSFTPAAIAADEVGKALKEVE